MFFTLFNSMNILSAFKSFVPKPHGFSDVDGRYNLGLTWTDNDGLTDVHNLELRYVRNSEKLALQGQPQPDGSWAYVETNGTVHTITAERAKAFMDKTQEHATIMLQMLQRLEDLGVNSPTLDTEASAV
jgi:hypothetical protein